MLVRHDNSSTLKRIKIVDGKNGQEVYICWEDDSKRRVRLRGDGYEIQGFLGPLSGNRVKGDCGWLDGVCYL